MASNETPRTLFTKVKAARELLRTKAETVFNQYMEVIQKATDAGQYDVAAKHLQWLIDHMPADVTGGERMVDHSVDKVPQQATRPMDSGPRIQIGIKVGGVNEQPKLPSVEVIDASSVKPDGSA